jgi:hypothetical protein
MEKTTHISIALSAIAALASAACSGESTDETPNDNTMGGGSSQTQGGSGGEAGGGGTSSGTSGSSGASGSAGGAGFTERGACGQRGEAPVNTTMFGAGFEEYYILGDRGFEPEVCIVRFAVKHLGDAPPGCVDCLWTHLVGFEMPTVMLDMDGVCANSELGMDGERMDEIVASTAAYGFVSEFSGHNSVLMKFDETTQSWEPYGNATWNPMTDEFTFNNRQGICGYGG